jgi:hypothetical protein
VSDLDDMQRVWRREDEDRLRLAASAMVGIEFNLGDPERLAADVADLRIALKGDDVARAELHAYNDERIRRVLARHQEWRAQDQASKEKAER